MVSGRYYQFQACRGSRLKGLDESCSSLCQSQIFFIVSGCHYDLVVHFGYRDWPYCHYRGNLYSKISRRMTCEEPRCGVRMSGLPPSCTPFGQAASGFYERTELLSVNQLFYSPRILESDSTPRLSVIETIKVRKT